MNDLDEWAQEILNKYLYNNRYSDKYFCYQYPPHHPYFKYICDKYYSLKKINSKNLDLLNQHVNYLYSINAPQDQINLIEDKIQDLIDLNGMYDFNYICSDDEEEVHFVNDYIDKKKLNLKYISKREIEFYILDKEELAKESFKPSRVNYILSLNPNYEF
jgi:hypothetical protein